MRAYLVSIVDGGGMRWQALTPQDCEAMDSMVANCKEGQIVQADFKRVGKRALERYRKNAHFHAYLLNICSEIEGLVESTGNAAEDAAALKLMLKKQALVEHPEFWRVWQDGKGSVTHNVFSLSITDTPPRKDDSGYIVLGSGNPLMLTDDEREEFYAWAFDTLVKLQNNIAGWHVPPFRNGGLGDEN